MSDDLQHYYEQLHDRRRDLLAREVKFDGAPPLEWVNQIGDYDKAIVLTDQVLNGWLSRAEWRKHLARLAVPQPSEPDA